MKLSQRTVTSDKTGGFVHIILPSGGNFLSYQIAVTDLLKGSVTGSAFLSNVTGAQTVIPGDNVYVSSIFVKKISGTPSIKIGTTVGGVDILPVTLITDFQVIHIERLFATSDILYFTITSGNVNIRVEEITSFI